MFWFVLITQLLLPVSLLIWIALRPAKGWCALVLQMISVLAFLFGIGFSALWTMPPFWTPYTYYALWLIILGFHIVSGRFVAKPMWDVSRLNTVILVLLAMLGGYEGYLGTSAMQGHTLPEGEVVDISPPFGEGHYLVASGGSTLAVNLHLKTLDTSIPRFKAWRGQSKALDIFRISPWGEHKTGWQPSDPSQYLTFGTPILAPCEGRVVRQVDGVRDMQVPQMDRAHMAGNHVILACKNIYIVLAHFRQGSIRVDLGDRVKAGDKLGEMGNSGNSSEPHLHIHAQRGLPDTAPLGGEPIWLRINGQFLARNDRIHVP